MKAIFLLPFIFITLSFSNRTDAQDNDTTNSSLSGDTVQLFISNIIKEVNRRSDLIDNIISEGEVTIKTKDIDNSGSIDIKAKKKDDVWFNITGPLGINIAEAHFGRKTFTFYNARADEVITGSSTIVNIGSLAKVRCTFDDLLNVFSGSVHIPKAKTDILSYTEETSQYVVQLVRGTITRKYWVDKTNYSVYKYAYYGKSGSTLIQFEFSNFNNVGDASYAKKVEVRRPKQGEYFALVFETINLGQNNLNFQVNYPSDVVHKTWH
ncbi:MAG: DUF4292 domain-containing protein [Ignavibacteria bacterium]|jgi:hypothetical protein